MTEGHKHRTVQIYEGTLAYRFLRWPMYHCSDREKVDESPYPYGPCDPKAGRDSVCWYLSPLSFLHRWTGLTLVKRGVLDGGDASGESGRSSA